MADDHKMNILEAMPMEPISYFNALLADPRITMLQFLDMQHPLEVARVYVPLRLSEERQRAYDAPASDEESTETTIADDPDVWIEQERQRRERSVEVIYDPEKAIHRFPRCVIMGDPGAGKTTMLRHLAIMTAQRSMAGMSSILPVYVELQSFVRSGRLIASAANLSSERVIPHLWKLRGEVLAALQRGAEAETTLRAAQEAARAQGLRPLLWRIYVALGKLYQAQAREVEAEQAFSTALLLIEELAASLLDERLREHFLSQSTAMLPRSPLPGKPC